MLEDSINNIDIRDMSNEEINYFMTTLTEYINSEKEIKQQLKNKLYETQKELEEVKADNVLLHNALGLDIQQEDESETGDLDYMDDLAKAYENAGYIID